MAVAKINGAKLKQAVEKFGTLEKATESLENKKEILEREGSKLKKETEELKLAREKLRADIDGLTKEYGEKKKKLQLLADNFGKWERQYNLSQGFIAMLLGSPSAETSLKSLLSLLQELTESGWVVTRDTGDLRSLFVRTVMGDYLKCFRCDACGAKFITNKKAEHQFLGGDYYCPVCHYWHAVKEDDSFLRAMVSEKKLQDIQYTEELVNENEVLKPFKAFLNMPCEVCHEPVKKWDDYNVKLAIEGAGCGHTQCWKGECGQIKEVLKAIKKVNKTHNDLHRTGG